MNTNMQTFLALELGRENVCVGGWVGGWVHACVRACVRACMRACVCSTSFGALKGRLKWSNLSEIWHTYSLGESMGVFFPFLKIFDLRGQGSQS